jgi:hypothetical protein
VLELELSSSEMAFGDSRVPQVAGSGDDILQGYVTYKWMYHMKLS